MIIFKFSLVSPFKVFTRGSKTYFRRIWKISEKKNIEFEVYKSGKMEFLLHIDLDLSRTGHITPLFSIGIGKYYIDILLYSKT